MVVPVLYFSCPLLGEVRLGLMNKSTREAYATSWRGNCFRKHLSYERAGERSSLINSSSVLIDTVAVRSAQKLGKKHGDHTDISFNSKIVTMRLWDMEDREGERGSSAIPVFVWPITAVKKCKHMFFLPVAPVAQR